MKVENFILDHPLLFVVGLWVLGCSMPFVAGVFTYLLEAP
jgi:hypothetical protein